MKAQPRVDRRILSQFSAKSVDFMLTHPKDGQRRRIYAHTWRPGFDPRQEGLCRMVVQNVEHKHGGLVVDAVKPLFDEWLFLDGLTERLTLLLGPGWNIPDVTESLRRRMG